MSPLTLLTIFRALLARAAARQRKRKRQGLIPSFGPSGERDRWYSVEGCLHLEAEEKVIVRRNRRGQILAILFRNPNGGHPLLGAMQPGQRYSFLAPVANTHIWQHQELETGPEDFQGVALGVTKTFRKEQTT